MESLTKHGVILEKTTDGFENEGVLNPAVIEHNGKIHIFYRAVSKGNYSTIGHCIMENPLTVSERCNIPVIFSQFDYESHGVEDPRIVKIDDLFYLSYTAYDGVNALGALAVSKDLITWEKKGLITPQISYAEFSRLAGSKESLNEKYVRYNQPKVTHEKPDNTLFVWDKNVVFFPRKIDKKLYFLHRIKPDIQIVCVEQLEMLNTEFWQNYFLHLDEHIVLKSKYKHEVSFIGGGCPPIETKHGWLIIYHGVYDTVNGYVYSTCAALLDLKNPQMEISRLPVPLFKPGFDWELKGEVNNVCFPTGTVIREETLYIYYGAADERIACASINMTLLLNELLKNTTKNEK